MFNKYPTYMQMMFIRSADWRRLRIWYVKLSKWSYLDLRVSLSLQVPTYKRVCGNNGATLSSTCSDEYFAEGDT